MLVLLVFAVMLLMACREPLVRTGRVCLFSDTCDVYYIAPGAYAAASSGMNAPSEVYGF